MSILSVLKDAWNHRDKLGESGKTRELAAFLPAALEIQESPQNPIAKWLGRSLILLFICLILWACLGTVNIVASAEGKIIPSSRVKRIQPLEKAVVKEILVREGEYVSKGQALIELDRTLTNADKQRITGEHYSAQLQLSVNQGLLQLLEAQQQQAAKVTTFAEMTLPITIAADKNDVLLHKHLLWQQWQEYTTQKKILENMLQRTLAEQAASREEIKKLQQTLPLINKRTEKMQGLLKKNFASETDFMALEQERIEMTQDFAIEQQRLKQSQASASEMVQKIKNLEAQTYTQTLTRLNDIRRQIATLAEELAKARALNAKQILYSPVSGQVQELTVNTIGGVVTEAQELMLVVPAAEKLEVEVFLANKDIGFIHEGMAAEIKIHTFPFTKYGIIDGEITNVSDDAILDEQRGLIYSMHLLMKQNTLRVEGKPVKLIPGMAVTAEIQTGRRKIIEFFLAPLLRYAKEGLRER
ncbi:secretion protein HlyD [Candidatus Endobugula sertula]|uniref:Membrane fusion protein (MFP) family protein n=1 Tax=Candidatus Endobugula sertula TaxID=62101 RepID=A0A1D2QPD2_9GAMM|nr:secretion protein HlyD [Candidatus Endobugula sertula]